jgi:hypothetical protein
MKKIALALILATISLVTIAESFEDGKPPKKRYIKLKRTSKKTNSVTIYNGVMTLPKGWTIGTITPQEQKWLDSICSKNK